MIAYLEIMALVLLLLVVEGIAWALWTNSRR